MRPLPIHFGLAELPGPLPRPSRVNCGFEVQGFAEGRRHGEDLGTVSELEDPVDAVGAGPLMGDLVLVSGEEEGRCI